MPDRPASRSDLVEVVDPAPYWDQLEARFGLSPSTFDGFVLVRPQSKKLHLAPDDHLPPEHPMPDTVGLPFLRTQMAVPKLTTAAAPTVQSMFPTGWARSVAR